MKPTYFQTADRFRRWLEKNHASTTELWVGLYKKGSGKRSITYKEALDEALCFGWIDGVRKRIDEEAYTQRFAPRRANSYWSAVNIRRATELKKAGRMHEAGLRTFERRDPAKANRYSFEREHAELDPAALNAFRANVRAWAFFEAQAPWYRRVMSHYVTSAKREETRHRRLQILIRESAAGRRVGVLQQK